MALLHVDFFSEVLGMSTQMDVILPERTSGIGVASAAWEGQYPTLYLLHGMSDDHTTWGRRTSIERYAGERGLAVVMPRGDLGWYTDMHIGYKYWTFVSQELVSVCRSFFPNMSSKREDTFAAGNSMGGYGALKLGLLANGTFSKTAPLSGGLDASDVVSHSLKGGARDARLWTDIFGPADSIPGSENDLFAVSERLAASGGARPDIFMWCGLSDFLYEQNTAMRDHLQRLGYNLTYTEGPGDHNWACWDAQIQNALDWLMQGRGR